MAPIKKRLDISKYRNFVSARKLEILLLFIPIAIYFLNLSSSLVGGDGDEYLLQSYQRGIAHPCGYPVYLWIGKIFLIILNNNLNSMSVISLFFSSLTLLVLYFFLCKMDISSKVAIASTLIFSFTPMFWKHAIIAEVYNVNAFFLVINLLLFYIWSEKHSIMSLLLCGVFYGISLGVYFPNILMLAPILIFIVCECVEKKYNFIRPFLLILIAILIGAIGPLLYIYSRSKIIPPIGTLYNPDNLRKFILYISGKQYGTMVFNSWGFLLKRIVIYSWLFFCSFVGVGLFFGLIGILSEWKKRKNYTKFLLISLMVNFTYYIYYGAKDSYTMMTLSYLIITVFISNGYNEISLKKNNMRKISFIILLLLITSQIIIFPSNYNISKKDNTILNECKEDLNLLPENSILFSGWYRFTSLLCLQSISRQRTDVTIYEISNQPRNYKIDNKIITFTWHKFIDDNISNKNKPIFVTSVDDYLKARYQIKNIKKELFFIYSG